MVHPKIRLRHCLYLVRFLPLLTTRIHFKPHAATAWRADHGEWVCLLRRSSVSVICRQWMVVRELLEETGMVDAVLAWSFDTWRQAFVYLTL